MGRRQHQLEETRRAILRALGEQIVESGAVGFSMQDVATRAGVTHRTVYNHFPTREALNDAFALFVEEELAHLADQVPPEDASVSSLPEQFPAIYDTLEAGGPMIRAHTMLVMATGRQAQGGYERYERLVSGLEDEFGPLEAGEARAIGAALRLFHSGTGWHLLTDHYGLSNEVAQRTSSWATRVLLEALSRGDTPDLEDIDGSPEHG